MDLAVLPRHRKRRGWAGSAIVLSQKLRPIAHQKSENRKCGM